jgi:hypothetical protein
MCHWPFQDMGSASLRAAPEEVDREVADTGLQRAARNDRAKGAQE